MTGLKRGQVNLYKEPYGTQRKTSKEESVLLLCAERGDDGLYADG